MRHAMASGCYLSIPKMIPAICEYVTESSRVLLHCVCLVQQAGYASLKIAAHRILVRPAESCSGNDLEWQCCLHQTKLRWDVKSTYESGCRLKR